MQNNNYSTGAASLFSVMARSMTFQYIVHRDWVLKKWNVYKKYENGSEDFVQAFDALKAAQDFCSINNGAMGK